MKMFYWNSFFFIWEMKLFFQSDDIPKMPYGASLYVYIQGSLNEFPDFFSMGIFIDSTHTKLYSTLK